MLMETSRRSFLIAAGAAAVAGAPGAVAAPAGGLRLITFERKDASGRRVGVVSADDRVLDLVVAKQGGAAFSFDPTDMISLIAAGAPALAQVREVAAKPSDALALKDLRLFSPIPQPQRNIYAVGWNYLEHFNESETAKKAAQTFPEHPVFFTKGSHTMNGPFDPIPFDPAVSTLIDWEGELAVVIGKRGRNIKEADAMDYVFGYSVINDTTARDVQSKRHGGQWFKGKSLDGHGPMGPWIVTADALDPDKLHLQTRVNGVVKQDAMTTQMYFKIPRILAELSLGLTLEAGDVIATGTPPGVGNARNPPEYLKPGDVMETEIAGIGTIRNTITQVA
jgi:2-keto-4-pentenoate hydratase/2-oxohepta-3-ene-1,7-dioic acid hydratase in catechol pathway